MKLAAILALATATAACGFDPQGAPPTLAERLRDRATVTVDPASQLDVTAVAPAATTDLSPTILGGEAILRTTADGYLLIEALRVPLADVTVAAGVLGPDPVTFTDLILRLGTQLSVPVTDPDGALIAGVGRADLVLDWAVIRDGQVLPLGMRKVRTPFSVTVAADGDDAVSLELATEVAGPAVAVLEVYQLRDLRLDVVGAER